MYKNADLSKNIMLTKFSVKNHFRSIMLTTVFLKKSSGTFFYKVGKWTRNKCPKKYFSKISFKTQIPIIYKYQNIINLFSLLRRSRVVLSNRHKRPSGSSYNRFQFIDPFLMFTHLVLQFLGLFDNLMNIQAGFRNRILIL